MFPILGSIVPLSARIGAAAGSGEGVGAGLVGAAVGLGVGVGVALGSDCEYTGRAAKITDAIAVLARSARVITLRVMPHPSVSTVAPVDTSAWHLIQ